ncbi:diaminopimelate epimerase [Ornithinibacillus halotolerans]|uniref:Diaminopimelate epimerase n=1 Tax=Ornithinibacillus halotolerans TaxID=1274357 RepID=A0A916RYC3_9BACI|nr:diaminopimelate epimerase [Ornithinibacillus halotolerans]GGA76655.1 diaminopimelate epimerase [Ornithinibacillus halotolerans]
MSLEIPFIKMHGLGNNYIYIDLFRYTLEEKLLSEVAMKVSDPNIGIGSDGMILIHPTNKADVGMRIFNKDGSEGKNCGNGLRCTAKYAYESGIVQKTHFLIETKSRIVEAEVLVNDGKVDEVTIDMGKPTLRRSLIPMLGLDSEQVVQEPFPIENNMLYVTGVSMGNPHAVFFVEDITQAPLYELGEKIEKDPRFPERVNVEFIEIMNEKEINFRVWERGSGVTQACGTGACAAVVAATLSKYIPKNQQITIHLQGGDLFIKWDENGHVWMTGEAKTIATGSFYYHN